MPCNRTRDPLSPWQARRVSPPANGASLPAAGLAAGRPDSCVTCSRESVGGAQILRVTQSAYHNEPPSARKQMSAQPMARKASWM